MLLSSKKRKTASFNEHTSLLCLLGYFDLLTDAHLFQNPSDVISTRRVSFILYFPDPQPWKPEYGGALELYPVSVAHEPEAVPTAVYPPNWNQFAFFPVIPGYSFHSVEEVVHPHASRLSIQGWFHRPGPEEEGFSQEVEDQEEEKRKAYSSAESLVSQKRTRGFVPYPDAAPAKEQEDAGAETLDMTSTVVPGAALSQEDLKFLSFFLNPAYLNPGVQQKLFNDFGDESNILLADFIKKDLAQVLERGLIDLDRRDNFRWFESSTPDKNKSTGKSGKELREHCKIQPYTIGTGPAKGTEDKWVLEGPPHHHRFLSLVDEQGAEVPRTLLGQNPALPTQVPETAEAVLSLLRSVLFPSPAFRAFLANVTQLIPLAARYPLWARRFRPGLDYTLAKKDESEAILHVNLGLTPSVADSLTLSTTTKSVQGLAAKRAKTVETPSSGGLSGKEIKDLRTKWDSGDAGGWECFMAPAEEDDDPAVYGSGSNGKKDQDDDAGEAETSEQADQNASKTGDVQPREGEEEEEEVVEMEEYNPEEDDFDGVLLNLTPQFNALNVVLRDEGVMHFVKYLSASAGGSRWDVEGEWRVGAIDTDDHDDDADGEGEDERDAETEKNQKGESTQ